jgi:hypothetical protein
MVLFAYSRSDQVASNASLSSIIRHSRSLLRYLASVKRLLVSFSLFKLLGGLEKRALVACSIRAYRTA